MKIIHLSDLHIGKRVNGFSMIEDQKYILDKIITEITPIHPEAVIIAGDVYDKPIPSAEAVDLLDDFIVDLKSTGAKVFIISGNHDSADRIAFGGRIMNSSGVFVSPVFNGDINPITLNDEYGGINFYLLPFIKPVHARLAYNNEEITTYTHAIKETIAHMNINPDERNILITHQFVSGAEKCESEELSVGGSDDIAISAFGDFDYIAIGHLHSPQTLKDNRFRYCGTPLKYSFSECSQNKSISVLDFKEKNNLSVETIPLKPLHEMHKIKGNFEYVEVRSNFKEINHDDYIHITLTDENDIPDAISRLKKIYPGLMKLEYDNLRTQKASKITEINDIEKKAPTELFAEFYEKQNNQPLTSIQLDFLTKLLDEIKEEEQK